MKSIDSRILIGVIVALAGAFIAFAATSPVSFAVGGVTVDNLQSTGLMSGHLELVARDSDGNIKSYQQIDNQVQRSGHNCIAQLLFRDVTVGGGSTDCGGDPSLFDVIGLGISSGSSESVDALASETGVAGLGPAQDTDVAVTDDGDGNGSDSIVEVLFTNGGATTAISEAGIFNDTTTGGTTQMLAYRSFTAISLDGGDSLTVTWTITVD